MHNSHTKSATATLLLVSFLSLALNCKGRKSQTAPSSNTLASGSNASCPAKFSIAETTTFVPSCHIASIEQLEEFLSSLDPKPESSLKAIEALKNGGSRFSETFATDSQRSAQKATAELEPRIIFTLNGSMSISVQPSDHKSDRLEVIHASRERYKANDKNIAIGKKPGDLKVDRLSDPSRFAEFTFGQSVENSNRVEFVQGAVEAGCAAAKCHRLKDEVRVADGPNGFIKVAKGQPGYGYHLFDARLVGPPEERHDLLQWFNDNCQTLNSPHCAISKILLSE